jgi:hypothetical protein
MEIKELEGADISLVEIRGGTPHCKIHGAMNMVNPTGVWRCISSYYWKPLVSDKGVPIPPKLVENACRAGCAIEGG